MNFTQEQVAELRIEYGKVQPRFQALQQQYILFPFKNPVAREHATQGFSRRLKTLVRCMQNVFDNIPPDQSELPSREVLNDAAINIQAFVLNVFGSLDNLAWIWVSENGQKRPDGTPIPNKFIGLGPRYLSVRQTFSPEFQSYLVTLSDWFAALGDLRDALVHRIPLYIPPYAVTEGDLPAYREFEEKMITAEKAGNEEEYDRLSVEQLKLGRYRPLIQHSYEENARPIVFHAQMIADFNTVDEVGRKLIEELKGRPANE